MRLRLDVRTCDEMGGDKDYALKPLEEAAELYGAWQAGEEEALIDEAADCIVSVCSLLARIGFNGDDLFAAVERANDRNRERGRL